MDPHQHPHVHSHSQKRLSKSATSILEAESKVAAKILQNATALYPPPHRPTLITRGRDETWRLVLFDEWGNTPLLEQRRPAPYTNMLRQTERRLEDQRSRGPPCLGPGPPPPPPPQMAEVVEIDEIGDSLVLRELAALRGEIFELRAEKEGMWRKEVEGGIVELRKAVEEAGGALEMQAGRAEELEKRLDAQTTALGFNLDMQQKSQQEAVKALDLEQKRQAEAIKSLGFHHKSLVTTVKALEDELVGVKNWLEVKERADERRRRKFTALERNFAEAESRLRECVTREDLYRERGATKKAFDEAFKNLKQDLQMHVLEDMKANYRMFSEPAHDQPHPHYSLPQPSLKFGRPLPDSKESTSWDFQEIIGLRKMFIDESKKAEERDKKITELERICEEQKTALASMHRKTDRARHHFNTFTEDMKRPGAIPTKKDIEELVKAENRDLKRRFDGIHSMMFDGLKEVQRSIAQGNSSFGRYNDRRRDGPLDGLMSWIADALVRLGGYAMRDE